MAVKHRCGFCREHLRKDGTCQNPDCPRYVPESETESEPKQTEKTVDTTH